MATAMTTENDPEALAPANTSGPRWLLLSLTLLLVALAVFQGVFLAPRCANVVQNFGGQMSPSLRLLLRITDWPAMVLGLALGTFVVWQGRSLHRLTLFATAALAVNVGLLLSVVNSLFHVLPR
jgi:hypothetical protein